jgi:hypothetical protein
MLDDICCLSEGVFQAREKGFYEVILFLGSSFECYISFFSEVIYLKYGKPTNIVVS